MNRVCQLIMNSSCNNKNNEITFYSLSRDCLFMRECNMLSKTIANFNEKYRF